MKRRRVFEIRLFIKIIIQCKLSVAMFLPYLYLFSYTRRRAEMGGFIVHRGRSSIRARVILNKYFHL